MSELMMKYNLLDKLGQQEVNHFIEFLLSKKSSEKKQNLTDYKKKILQVSTWSDDDIKVFEENKKQLNEWKISEW
jgi:hypothetical protein